MIYHLLFIGLVVLIVSRLLAKVFADILIPTTIISLKGCKEFIPPYNCVCTLYLFTRFHHHFLLISLWYIFKLAVITFRYWRVYSNLTCFSFGHFLVVLTKCHEDVKRNTSTSHGTFIGPILEDHESRHLSNIWRSLLHNSIYKGSIG